MTHDGMAAGRRSKDRPLCDWGAGASGERRPPGGLARLARSLSYGPNQSRRNIRRLIGWSRRRQNKRAFDRNRMRGKKPSAALHHGVSESGMIEHSGMIEDPAPAEMRQQACSDFP